jgi:ribonuclease-3
VHAKLTRTETLAEFALELQLNRFLLLGKGEQQANNNERSGRYVANAFEAVLGAIYLDQDIEAVKRFLLPCLDPMAHEVVEKQSYKNNKNLLQELAQKHTRITPSYRIISQQGPSHDKKFAVEVLLGENVVGKGQGITRKEAEQDAAKVALSNLGW